MADTWSVMHSCAGMLVDVRASRPGTQEIGHNVLSRPSMREGKGERRPGCFGCGSSKEERNQPRECRCMEYRGTLAKGSSKEYKNQGCIFSKNSQSHD